MTKLKGEVAIFKGELPLSKILRESDFFKDDMGNRFTLQMTGNSGCGDAEDYVCDEYALHNGNELGLGYLMESDMIHYTIDTTKNITKVYLCGLWLLPYKCVPVKLM